MTILLLKSITIPYSFKVLLLISRFTLRLSTIYTSIIIEAIASFPLIVPLIYILTNVYLLVFMILLPTPLIGISNDNFLIPISGRNFFIYSRLISVIE